MAIAVITGDAAINRKLALLETKVAKRSVRTAARAAVKPLASRTKAATPVLSGNLRRNIKVRALPRSRQWVGARVTSGNARTAYRGDAFYGGFIEFGRLTGKRGSTNRRPIPGVFFMRKTARRYQSAVLRLYRNHLRRDILAVTRGM